VGITGPDYESGWGVVDTEEAANIIKTNSGRHKIAEVYIPSGSSANFTCIAVGGQPIKVTMAWTDPQGVAQPAVVDPPGTGAGLKVLTNDLDLRVTDYQPTTLTYLPWAPDPAFPAGNPVPTGDNFRDNIEQVIIPTSTTGEYIGITITPSGGTALVGGGQWVSLIMSGLHQNGPWPSELTVFSATYAYVDPTHVTATLGFGTKVGGYYRIQVRPYGSPEGYWANASPVFYSRANSMVATSDPQGTPGAMLTFRVVSVSPNPFNL
jgi:hypothetical protein